jgi:hypothetical protein
MRDYEIKFDNQRTFKTIKALGHAALFFLS